LTSAPEFATIFPGCEKAHRVQSAMNFPAEKTTTVVLLTNAAIEVALKLHASAAL
jgi:hypothetical protein